MEAGSLPGPLTGPLLLWWSRPSSQARRNRRVSRGDAVAGPVCAFDPQRLDRDVPGKVFSEFVLFRGC